MHPRSDRRPIAIWLLAPLLASCAAMPQDSTPPAARRAALTSADFAAYSEGNVLVDATSAVEGSVGSRKVVTVAGIIDGSAYAPSITVKTGGQVGALFTNKLIKPRGSLLSAEPLDTNELPAAPTFLGAAPGAQALRIAADQGLCAGSYKTLTVKKDKVLTLPGGEYQFASIVVERGARIVALGPTRLRVATSVTTGVGSYLGMGEHALYIHAGGAKPGNVLLGAGSLTRAHLVASGKITVSKNALLGGSALSLRGITVGRGARIEAGYGDQALPAEVPAACDDGSDCTSDSCTAGTCAHSPVDDGTACDDGSACSQTDTCQAGSCVGGDMVVCSAMDQCHDAGTCDPMTGLCDDPAKDNGTACSDGNACTQTDTCQAGSCTGQSPVVCSASDQCHVAGTCDTMTGMCDSPSADNGTACNDGNAGTSGDVCTNGTCAGVAATAQTCKDIKLQNPMATSGAYTIDPDGAGAIGALTVYCDMTTDGGGWTIVHSHDGANNRPGLTNNVTMEGVPLAFQPYNLSRAVKIALSAVTTESLFLRNSGTWIKANGAMFDANLNTANSHMHRSVTITANNGATASGFIGYSNYNITGGGDYGVTTAAGFDHHSASYWHLNSFCASHYLYSYSSSVADSDASYNVNTALGSWAATATCTSLEGGGLVFYAAMR